MGGVNLYGFNRNNSVSAADYLGLAGEGIDCLEAVDYLMKHSPKVEEIVKKINSKKGCSVPPIICTCCEDPYQDAGGLYWPKHKAFKAPAIEICQQNSRTDGQIASVLRAELIHALQDCYKDRLKDSCEASLCDEIEQYYNAGCEHHTNAALREACVKGVYGPNGSGVGYSSSFSCTEKQFNDNFKKLYEKCKSKHM